MANLILIVEDNPDDILILTTAFRKAGSTAQLEFLTDGEQAIEYFSPPLNNRLPALMLLDVKLPKRSGLEVLGWIRSKSSLQRLPVIMLTASNQPEDINQAYDLGVNSYLVKPGGIEQLVALARSIETYWLATNARPEVGPLHFQPSLRPTFTGEMQTACQHSQI
jgi:CheY-like chemotaxis protein